MRIVTSTTDIAITFPRVIHIRFTIAFQLDSWKRNHDILLGKNHVTFAFVKAEFKVINNNALNAGTVLNFVRQITAVK